MIKKVFKSIVAILSIACLFTAFSCDWIKGGQDEKIIETYHQTTLRFFISPKKEENDTSETIYSQYPQPVMDTLVRFLESQIVAEGLLDSLMADGVDFVPTQKYQLDGTTLTAYYAEWISLICNVTEYTVVAEKTSCIDVSISILETDEMENEKEKATLIKNQLIKSIPQFVESKMYKPDGYVGTKCVLMTALTDIQTVVYQNGQKIN